MSIQKKVIAKYVTPDGKEFETLEEARAHTKGAIFEPLGWDDDTIASVIDGTNKPLADAVEALAAKVTAARRKRGELRRPYAGRPAAHLGQTAEPTGTVEEPKAA